MKILFDHSAPRPMAPFLPTHFVVLARTMGWSELENGRLITAAELAGFDLMLTGDKNLRYQQNLAARKLALVVLGNQQWPMVRLHLDRVVAAIEASVPGSYTEVDIPLKPRVPYRQR